ncbi:FkbM family methyltransferase, partial [Candidatus Parcubacteria bacterium]
MTRLEKVANTIRTEGVVPYLYRLYRLGNWRRYIRRFANPGWRNVSRAMCRGRSILLPPSKKGIGEELILYGVHEPSATELYERWLRPGETVLDVGSNIGYYLIVADAILGGKGQLHAFEPVPHLKSLLELNSSSLATSVTINQLAIAGHEGATEFYVSRVPNWGSTKKSSTLLQAEKLEVPATSIDAYCKRQHVRPTFIRMDIEGGEVAALEGALETLRSNPKLFIEVHLFLLTAVELRGISDILLEAGYDSLTYIDRYYDNPWSSPSAR